MRQTHVHCKVTRSIKLRCVQCSPEIALRNMDFCTQKNLNFPALLSPRLEFLETLLT